MSERKSAANNEGGSPTLPHFPELPEYHDSPPEILRAMDEWLAVDDRREQAARVRRWLERAKALPAAKPLAAAKPAKRARRARKTG